MKVFTHEQPGGEVVMAVEVEPGRTIKVIGSDYYRGARVADELDKWTRWHLAKRDGRWKGP